MIPKEGEETWVPLLLWNPTNMCPRQSSGAGKKRAAPNGTALCILKNRSYSAVNGSRAT